MICQATVADRGFDARDIAAPWCDKDAPNLIRLSLGSARTVNVHLCDEHADEYLREIDCA